MNSSKGYIGLRYRLYPNKKQKNLLDQYLGSDRFIWNHFLEFNIKNYKETKKFVFFYDLSKLLTKLKQEKEYSWLNDIPAHILQQALKKLSDTLGSFKKLNRGFPKFKSRKVHCDSFRLSEHKHDFKIKESEGRIKFPKGLGLVKVKFHRPIIGTPKSVTVTRDKAGEYYVSIMCEVDNLIPELVKNIQNAVGVDVGVKTLAVTSNGEEFKNNKHLRKADKKNKLHQRRLARKKRDSKNCEKQRKRYAKFRKRTTNRQTDDIRQTASSIAKNNDLIVLETLNLLGMLKNHKLARSLSEASLGKLINEIVWQCKKRGKYLIFIDQWFPSSQTCSSCGYINKEVKNLKIREWDCPQCGTHHNRDINASINILHEGLRKAIEENIIVFNQIPKELRKFTLVRKGDMSYNVSLKHENASKGSQGKKPQNL